MKKFLIVALTIIFTSNVVSAATFTKPKGEYTTSGGEEKGGSSALSGSSESSSKDSSKKEEKESSSNSDNEKNSKNGSSSSNKNGTTTEEKISVSEQTSRSETKTDISSSTKTVIDSYNWYFTNDGTLVAAVADDWLSKEMLKTTMNVSISYYHAGHYIGVRYPNSHTETTVTTTEYEIVDYEYTDIQGRTVLGSRVETKGSSNNTTKTESKEDKTKKYVEEWEVPVTGCDIGVDCKPITVKTPVPKLNQSEYDFDMEMTY